MLTRILHNSPVLGNFFNELDLDFSKPQQQHITNLVDAILVCESKKTLAALQRQFVESVDSSNIADFLRISPWYALDVRTRLRAFMLRFVLRQAEAAGAAKVMHVNIDDSIADKHKATRHIEVIDHVFDHIESKPKKPRYKNGLTYVIATLSVGGFQITTDVRLYLRARTVRRINRKRKPADRIAFISKTRLAQAILKDLQRWLPPDYRIYVHFDAWYAAAKLIKFIHRQGWFTVCAIKHNRKLNHTRVDRLARSLKHQRYQRVKLRAADKSLTTYLVRELTGRLEKTSFDVRVFISKRHHRDKRPAYFISTDLTLSAKQALQGYGLRWSCEVGNFYLKVFLGLKDFRVQSYEAVDKWCTIVHLAWAYLEWRFIKERSPQIRCPADILHKHRDEHAQDWLKGALLMAIQTADIEFVLNRFLPAC